MKIAVIASSVITERLQTVWTYTEPYFRLSRFADITSQSTGVLKQNDTSVRMKMLTRLVNIEKRIHTCCRNSAHFSIDDK